MSIVRTHSCPGLVSAPKSSRASRSASLAVPFSRKLETGCGPVARLRHSKLLCSADQPCSGAIFTQAVQSSGQKDRTVQEIPSAARVWCRLQAPACQRHPPRSGSSPPSCCRQIRHQPIGFAPGRACRIGEAILLSPHLPAGRVPGGWHLRRPLHSCGDR